MTKSIAILFEVQDNVDPRLYVQALVELLREPDTPARRATRLALSALTTSAAFAWSVEQPRAT